MKLLPNGRALDLAGVDYAWVEGGLIARVESYSDTGAAARQLGVLPPAGSALERASVAAANVRTRLLGRRPRP